MYEQPLKNGKTIVRVDTLYCLLDKVDESCFLNRDMLYAIVAGESDKYDINKLFADFYKRYPKIRKYVNDVYYYGDGTIPIIQRAIIPLREEIDTYAIGVDEILHGEHGKYLLKSRDYIYYAYSGRPEINIDKGVTYIC